MPPRVRDLLEKLAVGFVVATIAWYFYQRKTNGLRVELTASIPVVALQSELRQGVAITVRGDSVGSLQAVELRVRNTGNQVIRREDFDTTLVIEVPGRVVSPPTMTGRQPATLTPVLRVVGNQIVVDPLLLNPDDAFSLRTLVADWSGDVPIKISGHISNVSQVEFADVSSLPPRTKNDVNDGVVFLGIVAALLALVGFIAILARLRLPTKLSRVRDARASLQLTATELQAADRLVEQALSLDDLRNTIRWIDDRLIVRLRTAAAVRRNKRALKEGSLDGIVRELVTAKFIPEHRERAFSIFFSATSTLDTAWPQWRWNDDLKNLIRLGSELLTTLDHDAEPAWISASVATLPAANTPGAVSNAQ